MTATVSHIGARQVPGDGPGTWTVGAPRLLAGLSGTNRLDARAHRSVHGVLPATDLRLLTTLLRAAPVAGRGGAGYDLAAKLTAVHGRAPRIVVNGCESEPASYKDRVLLRGTPHLVLDGAVAAASAIGAHRITVAVHDAAAEASLRAAVSERDDGGRIEIRGVGGGFAAGESRALVRALDGGPALAPGRGGHLTDQGVLACNAETFAQLAVAIRLGPHRFGETGTRAEPGTTLLTVGGAVARPGVVEVPLGTPLGIVLTAAGAATVQALVIGGYHGSWHAPLGDILLSRDGLARAGGTLGAGVLLVLDTDTCALGELARVAGWLAAESAKQCGPCRFGLPALARDVAALAAGHPAGLGSALAHARAVTGRGACHHPDGAARFVTSGLHLLQAEAGLHTTANGCRRPVLGQLPIGGTR